ncbi:MAG: hypothetical protein J6Y82_11465, partial [Bacteroidales bacterium]|nr:hypothetical protein [Bacteroidales bacterium]
AYVCMPPAATDMVHIDAPQSVVFRTDCGIELGVNAQTLDLRLNSPSQPREAATYAYDPEGNIVGKLNVLTFNEKEIRVHLVSVNEATMPDIKKLQDEVNDIFRQAVVKVTMDMLDPVTIEYANGQSFVHGGKGTLRNYNQDQKSAIQALPKSADPNDYYLFLVECYDRYDTEGQKTNEVVSGYMPVGRHYGFIYNQYDNARTIAHELAHGALSLSHTFADGSESYLGPRNTNDNLMDYAGGTHLNHLQWKWAHETHRNILGFLDDEEESEENQITSAPICTQKFIEAFRYAYVNNKTLNYKGDISPYMGHYAKELKLLDGVVYKKLSVRVSQKLGTKISKQSITHKQLNGLTVYNSSDGKFKITTSDKFDEFDKYLYPDYDEWNQQMNGFVKQISALSERSEILEYLTILPAPLYERLDIQTRIKFLKKIADGKILEDYMGCVNDEEVVINLVGYIPNEQITSLFDELSKNNLMQTLCSKIENMGGIDNYSLFIAALLKTYMAVYAGDLQKAQNSYKKGFKDYKIFVWNKKFDTRVRVSYKQEYQNNKIEVTSWTGDKTFGDVHPGTQTVDPFEPIILNCQTAPTHVEGIKEKTVLAMPGFMFEWFLNEKDNKNIVDAIDLSTSVFSFGLAIKALTKAQRFIEIVDMIFATGNLALQNDAIRDYFKTIDEKLRQDGIPELLEVWDTASNLWSSVSKPILLLKYDESIKAFDAFIVLWNNFKGTPDYQTCPDDIKSAIDQLIDEYKPIKDE